MLSLKVKFMKVGLVLEGGAMQGIYTAGVLDVFMENGITFDGIIGVSAGALFGVNMLSGQIGRALRYCKKYNKEYMGLKAVIKTGELIDVDYAYRRVPFILDPFDDKTFNDSEIPFYAVITNMETGMPEYPEITSVVEQMDILRASGTMPYVSKPVDLNGHFYMDGAVTDSIPFKKMFELGYDKLVVVLTKSREYVKKPLPQTLATMMYGKKYPEFAFRVRDRHNMYNKQKEDLFKMEAEGNIKIILPTEPLYISKKEGDPEKLEPLYQLGRRDARDILSEIIEFKSDKAD